MILIILEKYQMVLVNLIIITIFYKEILDTFQVSSMVLRIMSKILIVIYYNKYFFFFFSFINQHQAHLFVYLLVKSSHSLAKNHDLPQVMPPPPYIYGLGIPVLK